MVHLLPDPKEEEKESLMSSHEIVRGITEPLTDVVLVNRLVEYLRTIGILK